jgi:GNAT superfamily N-acetyltransferase
MDPSLTVRPATPADVPLILALIRELADYERAPEQAVATPALLHAALFGPRPSCEALIGLVDGQPQGFALYFTNFSTWLGRPGIYLEDLFVRPPARQRGLGKALLIALARTAKSRGCARMEWSVLDWNTPAHDFYRTLGAKPMDEWTTWRMTESAIDTLAQA